MGRPRKGTRAVTGAGPGPPGGEVLPLHVMLAAMRRAWAQAEAAERLAATLADDAGREAAEREAAAARKLAQAWAKDCAPYLHARLSTAAAEMPDVPAYVILGAFEEGSEAEWTERHTQPNRPPAGSKGSRAPGTGG